MTSISRWTLTYFSCALLSLVVALGMLAMGFGIPVQSLSAPSTLIVVHLLAVGWLTLLMLGALFQFLPVLIGRDLVGGTWTPAALLLITTGLTLLVGGFTGLDGWLGLPSELLPIGGLFLLCGFTIAASVLIVTLLRADSLPLPAGFVAVALLCILVAALIGETLAATLAGLVGGEFSVALVTHGVALHAGFGLGGWLSLAAVGVSYRLVSMFLLSPERKGMQPRAVFGFALLALAALLMALGILLALNASWPLLLSVAGVAALVAVGAYLGDIAILYRSRRRKTLELHTQAALGAFGMLALGGVVLLQGNWTGHEPTIAAAVYLLVLGWLSGLGLAMLYKIVPFLTWLECFAPIMGRQPTPRVQDLVAEPHARIWFVLYFFAVATAASTIQAGLQLATQVAIGVQLVAVLALIHQFMRARRLIDIPMEWRDRPRPHLFLPH